MRPIETPRLCLRTRRSPDVAVMFGHSADPLVGPPAGWACRRSMEEAARAVIRQGFGEMGPVLIACGRFGGDLRSRRAIEKCGFRYALPKIVARDPPDGKEVVGRAFCLARETCLTQKEAAEAPSC